MCVSVVGGGWVPGGGVALAVPPLSPHSVAPHGLGREFLPSWVGERFQLPCALDHAPATALSLPRPGTCLTLMGRPWARGCWTQVRRRRAHLVGCEGVAVFKRRGGVLFRRKRAVHRWQVPAPLGAPPLYLPAADGGLSIALDLTCLAGRAGPALLVGPGHGGRLLVGALHDAWVLGTDAERRVGTSSGLVSPRRRRHLHGVGQRVENRSVSVVVGQDRKHEENKRLASPSLSKTSFAAL